MNCIVCGRQINIIDNIYGRYFCDEKCYELYKWIKEQTEKKK